MRPRTLLLGALLATAALLAACSADPAPLNSGGFTGAGGGICTPLAIGQPPVTDGFSILDNASSSPVTVTGVKLALSHGLNMTKAWLIPLAKSPSGGLNFAGEQNYPPTTWPTWSQRQPIPGAVIKPRQQLNLVFGLARTGPKVGRTSGPVVTYTAGGNSYTLREGFGFVLVAPHTRCPRTG